MTKKILFLLLFIIPLAGFSQADLEAVKHVVTSAYIEGIQNRGSIDDIRKGFHPGFNMLRLVENDIKPLPIEEWITSIEKSRNDNQPRPKTTGKFVNVDITGNAAVVKLELYREDKKTFTDYLVLYKFEEGWRIVSKTYFRH